MYKLYDFASSGNCYKLRLAMSQLGIEYQRLSVDILQGQTRTADFLRVNPTGKVPLLETPDGRFLPESNAALWYLARGTPLCPSTRFEQAQALQWMFFEQNRHEPNIAELRYWISMLKVGSDYETQIAEKRRKSYEVLDIMERHLSRTPFFVAGQYSIADIALYAYTHVAHEGQLELETYPAMQQWLSRIEKTDKYVSISEL